METIKEGFEDLMKQCWPKVDKKSTQYRDLNIMFHAGITWIMATVSDAVKAKEENVIEAIRKELEEFVKHQEKRASIEIDILKSGRK